MPINVSFAVPYLFFLGHVPSHAYAKAALRVFQWPLGSSIAQLRFPKSTAGTALVGSSLQDNWPPSPLGATAESLSSAGQPDDWDIIEGLGSLFQSVYSCVAPEARAVYFAELTQESGFPCVDYLADCVGGLIDFLLHSITNTLPELYL